MDLIYTNSGRVDQGVLLDYELDLAFGADENNLECRVQAGSHCCESGSLMYMEGTEYGGIVDSIESDTDSKEVIYTGRTWHGILNSKVLQPDSGAAYLTVSGEANSVIASLLTRMGLTDLFEASAEDSGLTVKSYKMNRYISGYDGIMKMLGTVGGKLKMAFSGGKVVLSAAAVHDYTQDEEFDADQVPFRAKRNYKGVNHLICLGSGQLEERMVVHLYADTDGNISQTQTQFGLDEICTIFEYSNIETKEELIQEGTEKLESLMVSDEISIDFDADSDAYDVGDIIGAVDNITGLMAYTTIAKKIVTIKNGQITVSLSPDTARSGSSMEVGGVGTSAHAHTHAIDGKDPITPEAIGAHPNTWLPTPEQIGAARSNQNLLPNAYFGNPVDQRGGYVVPPGASCWQAGDVYVTTDKYYKVEAITADNTAKITINGVESYATAGAHVRGYTGAGYTIDRLLSENSYGTVVIEDSGSITLSASGGDAVFLIKITLAEVKTLLGKKVSLSVLTMDDVLYHSSNEIPDDFTGDTHGTVVHLTNGCFFQFAFFKDAQNYQAFRMVVPNGKSVSLQAAKLELGTEQTLAHQVNGKWVPNEIPNYAETLVKCQRYFRVLRPNVLPCIGYYAAGKMVTFLLQEVLAGMRATPQLTLDYDPLSSSHTGKAVVVMRGDTGQSWEDYQKLTSYNILARNDDIIVQATLSDDYYVANSMNYALAFGHQASIFVNAEL